MSRVYSRKGRWYVDFADETGERQRRALKDVKSKREAEAHLAELVAQVRRRRLGLEATPISLRSTVWQLCEWWLEERCPKASLKKETSRLTRHVKGSELGGTQVAYARGANFEVFFSELEKPVVPSEQRRQLSPASIMHLRAKLSTVFERARREGIFHGANPVRETRARKIPKRVYETLTAEEVPRVLRLVKERWRGFIAAGIYLALRKGEIAGMRKVDVDLVGRTVTIRWSYLRSTTKGGHEDVLPIPEPLVPYLEEALKTPGPWLFPDKKGRMRTPEADPHLVLRRAIGNAGLVTAYVHNCRRCKAAGRSPVRIESPSRLEQKCPQCKEQKLWARPVARHVRFHDLRHSTATILLRAGVSPHHVQRIMRHADIKTTTSTYGHLVVEDLRAAMGPLSPAAPQKPDPIPTQQQLQDTGSQREAASK